MQQEMGNGTGLLAISCIAPWEHRDLRLPHSAPRGAHPTLTLGVSLAHHAGHSASHPSGPGCLLESWPGGRGGAAPQGRGCPGAAEATQPCHCSVSSPSAPPFLPCSLRKSPPPRSLPKPKPLLLSMPGLTETLPEAPFPGATLLGDGLSPGGARLGLGCRRFPGWPPMAPAWHPPPKLPAARKGVYLLLPLLHLPQPSLSPSPGGARPPPLLPVLCAQAISGGNLSLRLSSLRNWSGSILTPGEPHLTH